MAPTLPYNGIDFNSQPLTFQALMSLYEAPKHHQRLHLLGLPQELLEAISLHLDTPSFYAFLLSCKDAWAAAQSKKLLLHHINQIPGRHFDRDDFQNDAGNKNIFLAFRQRAAANSLAAGFLSDVAFCGRIDRLSNIAKATFTPRSTILSIKLAMADTNGTVFVYEPSEDIFKPIGELILRPDLPRVSSPPVEVVKIAFSGLHDVTVLYRSRTDCETLIFHPDLVEETDEFTVMLQLVTFDYPAFGPSYQRDHDYSSWARNSRAISCGRHDTVISLAMSRDGTACIVWKVPGLASPTKVILYPKEGDEVHIYYNGKSVDSYLSTFDSFLCSYVRLQSAVRIRNYVSPCFRR